MYINISPEKATWQHLLVVRGGQVEPWGFHENAMCWAFENIWLHVSAVLHFCIRFLTVLLLMMMTLFPSKMMLQHFKFFRDLIFSPEKHLCWCLSLWFLKKEEKSIRETSGLWQPRLSIAPTPTPLGADNNHKPASVYCEQLWIRLSINKLAPVSLWYLILIKARVERLHHPAALVLDGIMRVHHSIHQRVLLLLPW